MLDNDGGYLSYRHINNVIALKALEIQGDKANINTEIVHYIYTDIYIYTHTPVISFQSMLSNKPCNLSFTKIR